VIGIQIITSSVLILGVACSSCSRTSGDLQGTSGGNPRSEIVVAPFSPLYASSSLSVCVVGLTMEGASSRFEVNFDRPQEKLIQTSGIEFDALTLVQGRYTQASMRLANSCPMAKSLVLNTPLGTFQSTDDLTFRFEGEVVIEPGTKRIIFNLQPVYREIETVSSNAEIPVKTQNISGQVTNASVWTSMSTAGAPVGRSLHGTVWTGNELIVWGGFNTAFLQSGGRYAPSTNSWASTSTVGAPSARMGFESVWIGSEMIVWGGETSSGYVGDGARYNPGTNTWTAMSPAGAPAARAYYSAVWTGSRMLIWGGEESGGVKVNSGAIYDPALDSWTMMSTTGVPSARVSHTAVWTGTEMLIWGGCYDAAPGCPGGNSGLNTGARYNPQTNVWTPITTAAAPSSRHKQVGVWTGTEMIIWSGQRYQVPFGSYFEESGGRYHPVTDTWQAISVSGSPTPRTEGASVWTGSKLFVWGGIAIDGLPIDSGALYDPATDAWTAVPQANAPERRTWISGYWTGFEVFVWGGWKGAGTTEHFNTGGRFRP
jgi:hypothetical protein